jgi:hypothetical protein
MKIITKENPVILENTGKDGEYFSLRVFPSSTIKKIGFQIVFPEDCEVIKFSDNSIIIQRMRPEEDEED